MRQLVIAAVLAVGAAACSTTAGARADAPPSAPRASTTGSPTRHLATRTLPGSAVRVEISAAVLGEKSPVECWTYVTDGLAALHHPELAMAVKREPGEAESAFPQDPLDVFETLVAMVRDGSPVEPWTSGTVPNGLFGRKDLTGVVFVPEVKFAAKFERPTLTVLVVTQDELSVAGASGTPRVVNMLGMRARQYPTCAWVERKRGSVTQPRDLERSLLVAPPKVWLSGAGVVNGVSGDRVRSVTSGGLTDARLEGNRSAVVLRLTPSAGRRLAKALGDSPQKILAVLLAPDPTADGRLTWTRGPEVAAITGPEANPARLTGNFVIFVATTEVQGAKPLEDGYGLILPPEQWPRLIAALENAAAFAVPGAKDASAFELEWVRETEEAAAKPGRPAEEPTQSAIRYRRASPEVNTAAQRRFDEKLRHRDTFLQGQVFKPIPFKVIGYARRA